MSDLSEFLKKKKAEYAQEKVDWSRVGDKWIHQLKGFMEQIDPGLRSQKKKA